MHKVYLRPSYTCSYFKGLLASSHGRQSCSIWKVAMEGDSSEKPENAVQRMPSDVFIEDLVGRIAYNANANLFLPNQPIPRNPFMHHGMLQSAMQRNQFCAPSMQWNPTIRNFMSAQNTTAFGTPSAPTMSSYNSSCNFHTNNSSTSTALSSSGSPKRIARDQNCQDTRIPDKRKCSEDRDQQKASTSASTSGHGEQVKYEHSDTYLWDRETKKRTQYMKSVLQKRKIEKVRHISKDGEVEFTGLKFTVASYNILAQDLLQMNMDLYSATESRYLNWDYRRSRLIAEIKYHRPDVLCLQEMNVDHYGEFTERLGRLGYKGLYKKRKGDKMDGCATFYQGKVFDLVKSRPVMYYRDGASVLDRDNVALIVKLKPKHQTNAPPICIANTHLLFNPKRGDVKLAQIAVLLAEMDKIAYSPNLTTDLEKPRHDPVIICGDFNSLPHCNLYKFLTMGKLQYEGLLQQTMSGQKVGIRGGGRFFEKHFLPHHVGITSQCQFLSLIPERIENYTAMMKKFNSQKNTDRPSIDPDGCHGDDKQQSSNDDKVEYCSSHPPQPTDLNTTDPETIQSWADQSSQQSTGHLSHNFNLKSIYNHRRLNRNGQWVEEATTCHGKVNCTVDYIFYSLADCQAEIEEGEVRVVSGTEGPLKLTGRLGLVSCEDMNQVGPLPNAVASSDHVILMAEFVLEDQRHWQCDQCYK